MELQVLAREVVKAVHLSRLLQPDYVDVGNVNGFGGCGCAGCGRGHARARVRNGHRVHGRGHVTHVDVRENHENVGVHHASGRVRGVRVQKPTFLPD